VCSWKSLRIRGLELPYLRREMRGITMPNKQEYIQKRGTGIQTLRFQLDSHQFSREEIQEGIEHLGKEFGVDLPFH
ncbi:hypothetical protein CLOSTHATH_05882, partial [Hungatella hathewayi DSM 13479]